MNRYGGEIFEINEVGRVIVESLGRSNVGDLYEMLRDKFSTIDPDIIFHDLEQYIEELETAGIIKRVS